jgi:hypothetical protein
MKKVFVLCLLTLAAVVLDVALFQSRSVAAQSNVIRVERVTFSGTGGGTVPISGRVVGFHCLDVSGIGAQCFVASGTSN